MGAENQHCELLSREERLWSLLVHFAITVMRGLLVLFDVRPSNADLARNKLLNVRTVKRGEYMGSVRRGCIVTICDVLIICTLFPLSQHLYGLLYHDTWELFDSIRLTSPFF